MSEKLAFCGIDKEADCMVYSDAIGLGPFFEFVDDGRIDINKVARFVCNDKNGKPVYAGDFAETEDCKGRIDRLKGIYIDTGGGTIHHVWPDEIELITTDGTDAGEGKL